MTCIVAIKHNGRVLMGADSAAVGGLSISTRKDPKIYVNGPFMFGFTTSFRMGQILGHCFKPPKKEKSESIEKFMSTKFIDEVRNCLRAGGYSRVENNEERGGWFIVSFMGRIFRVQPDFQVSEELANYTAVGCGEDIALGSLHASSKTAWSPESRIKYALQAAEEYSAGVRRPFIIREHFKGSK
jgi:ATP-dependent protease HslVU (ClpYQ) peptidase subunit